MTAVSPTPNVEAAISTVLIDGGMRAYSSLPKRDPVYPLVIVSRAGGGSAVRERLDAARIQIEGWGDDKSAALAAVTQGRVLIYAAEGTRVDEFDCFITGVEDEVLNQWLPDPPTGKPRYISTLRVFSHEAVGGS